MMLDRHNLTPDQVGELDPDFVEQLQALWSARDEVRRKEQAEIDKAAKNAANQYGRRRR